MRQRDRELESEERHWKMPLDERPTIVQMSTATHGVRAPVERFRLNLWSLHVYNYDAELLIEEQVFTLSPGSVGVIAPGKSIEYRYRGRSEHIYAHFTLPEIGSRVSVPILRSPVSETTVASYERSLREALLCLPSQRRRAEVRLWDLLWQLAEGTSEEIRQGIHPAVQQALLLIDRQASEGIRVSEIAQAVGLSHGHLTRLFQQSTGESVIAALQEKRVERARHLLIYSDLAVKDIAAQVGIPDLNLFNKTIRRHCGASPRALRAYGPGRPTV